MESGSFCTFSALSFVNKLIYFQFSKLCRQVTSGLLPITALGFTVYVLPQQVSWTSPSTSSSQPTNLSQAPHAVPRASLATFT